MAGIYGGVVATTPASTQTATLGQVIYLSIPTLATPTPVQYTTPPSPTSLDQTQDSSGLPILVLTQVDNTVVDPSGSILETATILQGLPSEEPTLPSGQPLLSVLPDNGWGSWTAAEKAGVIVAALLLGLGLIAAGICVCCVQRKRKKAERDMEKRLSGPRRRGSGREEEGRGIGGAVVREWLQDFGRKRERGERKGKRRVKDEGLPGRRPHGGALPDQRPRSARNSQGMNNRRPIEMSGAINEQTQPIPPGLKPLRPPQPNQRRNVRENPGVVGVDTDRSSHGGGIRSGAVRSDAARQQGDAHHLDSTSEAEVSIYLSPCSASSTPEPWALGDVKSLSLKQVRYVI